MLILQGILGYVESVTDLWRACWLNFSTAAKHYITANNQEKGLRKGTFQVITHRLIVARPHWTKHITWYKIGWRVSGDTLRPFLLTIEKEANEIPFSGFYFSDLITV